MVFRDPKNLLATYEECYLAVITSMILIVEKIGETRWLTVGATDNLQFHKHLVPREELHEN